MEITIIIIIIIMIIVLVRPLMQLHVLYPLPFQTILKL